MQLYAGLTLAALVTAAFSIAPAQGQSKHYTLSVETAGSADSCADLKVKSTGAVSLASEKFTLQGASVRWMPERGAPFGARRRPRGLRRGSVQNRFGG